MASLTHTEVSSEGLQNLQSELRALSTTLNDLYDTLWGNLNILGEEWTDSKWEEFSDAFKDDREKVLELADKYKEWADTYIQRKIEEVEDFLGTNAGIK